MQKVKTIAQAVLLTIGGSLLVRKAATVAVAGLALGLGAGVTPAHAQRLAAFAFQCVGPVGAFPAQQFRGTATTERYKVVGGQVKIDKRAYKDINMDCAPGVNNGAQQNIMPTFLDTDGRVIAIDGKVYTRATSSAGTMTVIHEVHIGNNFFKGTFMALPERTDFTNAEVQLLISISNPSFEP